MRAARAIAIIASFLAALSAGIAAAQDPPRELDVEVISAIGDEFYLDRGREAGLAEGDRVFFPATGVELRIVAVAGSTSRARPLGEGRPAVGDRGRAFPSGPSLSEPRSPAVPAPTPSDAPPVWEGPLLAPSPEIGAARAHRFRLSGRWTFSWLEGREEGDGRDTRSSWGRTRLDLLGEDIFAEGDAIEFDGQVFQRSLETDLGDEEETTRGRVETLAYRSSWGFDRALAWQAGRFYGQAVPELGRHDGAEVEWRPAAGTGFGVLAGLLAPRSTEDDFGEDTSVVAYARHIADDPGSPSGAVALQHTWHDGEGDRDLIFARGGWEPLEDLDLWASAWLDIYSGEEVKDDGVELTQLWLQAARELGRANRVRASYQELRIPEIARNEAVLPEILEDSERRILGLATEHDLGETWVVAPRADLWWDEEDDGLSLELEVRAIDLLVDGQEIRVAVFRRESRFSTSPGVSASVRQSLGAVMLSAGVEGRRDEFDDWVGEDLEADATRLWGQVDWFVGAGTSLSFTVERDAGDEQDGLVLGGSVQVRF